MKITCHVCGGINFSFREILSEKLVMDWQLAGHEVDYINRQQGLSCVECGANLRSIALAKAMLNSYGVNGTLLEFVDSPDFAELSLLEINRAGSLTPVLERLKYHKLVTYPDCNMTDMQIESSSYDLVVHSDTLEHIDDPIQALSECRRVLSSKGRCIFTVPMIVDRLSRTRQGLTESYHGEMEKCFPDLMVYTEFGADAWKYVFEAGFSQVELHCIEYPSAIAIEAKR